MAAGGSALTTFAGAGQLAAWLRARDTVLLCGTDTVVIDKRASGRAQPDVMPTGEALANGQLILPMPTGWSQPSGKRKPTRGRETQNPHRDPQECE
ncbi:hypothetical protein Areg01_47550 [Actinoplanes regularis]|nr:hypothetical protein Areg01_47550 [Actinoplanes regularis]